MCASAEHWDRVYLGGDQDRSWYQPQAEISTEFIEQYAPDRTAAIVDVGGGASVLVDDLVSAGYTDLTVLDISAAGLDIARQRIDASTRFGADQSIEWLVADVAAWQPQRQYDLWHDRAVLHFMLDELSLDTYRRTMMQATRRGSILVLGIFGPKGPASCSGLAVRRWSQGDVATFLGDEFTVIDFRLHVHVTPSGADQQFAWTVARRVD